MLTEQDLQLLSQMMDQKLASINQRLDRLESKVDRIAENMAINRKALESIIEWTQKVGSALHFPLRKR